MAATYTVTSRATTPLTTQTVTGLTHEQAVQAAITAVQGTTGGSAPGVEVHVPQCTLVSMSGPTGTYSATTNYTAGPTGSTYSAVSHDDAVNQAVTALGPTGPGAGISIFTTSPQS